MLKGMTGSGGIRLVRYFEQVNSSSRPSIMLPAHSSDGL